MLEELTYDQKHICPDERFFVRIECDFETIHTLGINLGFKLEEIEEFVAYSPRSVSTQLLKMLSTWRKQKGTKATFKSLLEAMKRSKIPEHCYKDAVLEFFRDQDSEVYQSYTSFEMCQIA